jgi:CDP-diacylglycerol--glycerol-3-phosphate 3-phosphatidyltransferase
MKTSVSILPAPATDHSVSLPFLAVFSLTTLRLLLAPTLLVLAKIDAPGWAFATCLSAAFLSDIYDGVIARRFGIATHALRRFDSATDTVFYLTLTGATWLRYPEAIHANLYGILAIIALELLRAGYDLHKFGRQASYHMWSAKTFGLFLFLAFLFLFGFDVPTLLPVAVLIGVISELEGLAASIVLREWRHDLPSLWHAYQIAYPRSSPYPLARRAKKRVFFLG